MQNSSAAQLIETPNNAPIETDLASTLLYFPPASTPPAQPALAPTAPPRLASSLPDAMIPDLPYSLLDDIRQSANAHHVAKEKVSLYGFPCYLSTNIRRVLSRSNTGRADWSVAFSCLLWQGLMRYSSLPATLSLTASLSALDTDDALDAVPAEQVEMWRRGFRYSVSDPTHTMGFEKRRTFKVPEHVHTELHDLSSRLGLISSTLGTLAVMAALSEQDGVLADHSRHMQAAVAEVDRLLVEREARLRKLVGAIEAGVWR